MGDFKNDNIWLMKGDCLERMKEIPDGSVDLVLCDPPYGTTVNHWDSIVNFDDMWKEVWRVLQPKGVAVLCSSQPFTSLLTCSQIRYWKSQWTWSKNKGSGHLNAKKMPMRFTETLEVFYKKPPTYNPQMTTGHKSVKYVGNRSDKSSSNYGKVVDTLYESGEERHPRNILDIPVVNNDGTGKDGVKLHPTQKPVELMEYMIKTYTNEGESVLDFTMGSGATIKAAKNLNRKAIGIEIGHCEKKGHKYEGVHWVDVLVEEMNLNGER